MEHLAAQARAQRAEQGLLVRPENPAHARTSGLEWRDSWAATSHGN